MVFQDKLFRVNHSAINDLFISCKRFVRSSFQNLFFILQLRPSIVKLKVIQLVTVNKTYYSHFYHDVTQTNRTRTQQRLNESNV
jgi:hypothetical protein